MERPVKRLRMWKPEESLVEPNSNENQPKSSQPLSIEPQEHVLPTRTIDLSDFRRRAFHAYRKGEPGSTRKRNGVMYLMPRAPIATVTAKVIDIAIDDGKSTAPVTQLLEPSNDLVITVGSMGTLTVPGAGVITNLVGSLSPDLSGSSGSSGSGLPGSLGSASSGLPVTSSYNATSVASGDNTVTMTTTSTLTATYRNGTLIAPIRTSTTRTTSTTKQKLSQASTTTEDDPEGTLVSETPGGSFAAPTSHGNHGGATTSSSSPQATASDSGGSGITLSPQQQQVVGGVVGGVAGVALVLVAILYLLKWYRQRVKRLGQLPQQRAASQDLLHTGDGSSNDKAQALSRPHTSETQRSSIGPIAAIASRLKQLRPYSTNTLSTASTRDSVPSGQDEKSFQRVAGRKIPSVLSSGGDGYGGNYGVFEHNTHQRDDSQASIYQRELINARPSTRGQPNQMSEPSTPTRIDPFADPPSAERKLQRAHRSFSPTPNFSRPSVSRDFADHNARSQSSMDYRPGLSPIASPVEGFATLRPSPARTPMTQSPVISAVRIPEPSSTPPLMAGNVPDLPSVPVLSLPPKRKIPIHGPSQAPNSSHSMQQRTRTSTAERSSSIGGRFKEDI